MLGIEAIARGGAPEQRRAVRVDGLSKSRRLGIDLEHLIDTVPEQASREQNVVDRSR
jgi:hypothetical protein